MPDQPQALERAWTRPLSGMERGWLVADRLSPPFVNQLVVELDRLPPREPLEAAVAAAAEAHPGMRMVLTGALGWTRWRATGPAPPLVDIDGASWDGMSSEGAPFLLRPLPPRTGPTAEVLRVSGPTPRLVIRTHHALTDGRGASLFAADLFRHLRGQVCQGADCGPPTDAALARALGMTAAPDPPPGFAAPTGVADPGLEGTRWARITIADPPRPVLAHVVIALARLSRAHGPLRFGVPVDLRRHRPQLRSTANLTGILHLDPTPLLDDPDPVAAAHAAITQAVASMREGQNLLAADRLRWWPLNLLTAAGRALAREQLKTSRFSASAALSNLGRQDLDAFSTPYARATALFWIPPASPSLPLFMTLSGHANGLDLCATMPEALASQGRLQTLLAELSVALGDGLNA